jgi:hypothetical protein
MVERVADEDAWEGPRTQLVGRCCRSVGVAQAAKDAEVVVARRLAEQQLVRRRGPGGAAGAAVQQVSRRLQGFCPEGQRCYTVNKHGTHTIVNGSKNPLGFSIFVVTCKDTISERKCRGAREAAGAHVYRIPCRCQFGELTREGRIVCERKQERSEQWEELQTFDEWERSKHNVYNHQEAQHNICNLNYCKLERSKRLNEQVEKGNNSD